MLFRSRYAYYKQQLSDLNGIRLFDDSLDTTKNYAYFPILIEPDYHKTRNEIYDQLNENNIHARKYFYPLTSSQACFRNKYRNSNLINAQRLSESVLTIPFYENLEQHYMEKIVDMIKQ